MVIVKTLPIVLLVMIAGCTYDNIAPENKPDLKPLSITEQTVSGANANFAFSLFRTISKDDPSNIFISPLSTGMALGMVLNGAEGTTKDGILKTIDYSGLQPSEVDQGYHDLTSLLTTMDNKVEVDLANGIWYDQQYKVKSDFSKQIEDFYAGKSEGLNFADPSAKDAINNWVAGKTQQRIKDLVDGTDNSIMILINAIYFKGSWSQKFDKALTKQDNFHSETGNDVVVDMMYCEKEKLSYAHGKNFSFIDIPYGNGQFSMSIVLPDVGKSLAEIVQTLSMDTLRQFFNDTTRINCKLYLPKFKMDWKGKLNAPLSSLGMPDAFNPDKALFPNLFDDLPLPPPYINAVIHQSYIEVDEAGSEAAAATEVSVVSLSAVVNQTITQLIRVDHPFAFFIREKHSGVILFAGQMYNPADGH